MPPGIVCTENVRIIVVANHNCRFWRSADLLEGIIKKTAVGLGYIYVVRQYQLGDIFIYTARLQFARLQIGKAIAQHMHWPSFCQMRQQFRCAVNHLFQRDNRFKIVIIKLQRVITHDSTLLKLTAESLSLKIFLRYLPMVVARP